jgi:hypothetical protein
MSREAGPSVANTARCINEMVTTQTGLNAGKVMVVATIVARKGSISSTADSTRRQQCLLARRERLRRLACGGHRKVRSAGLRPIQPQHLMRADSMTKADFTYSNDR